MPSDPDNRKIEELLKAYGKKREADLGAPLELHPATRKMLQAEAAKLRPGATTEKGGFVAMIWRFWPRFAIAGGVAVLLSLAIVNLSRHPKARQELALNKTAKEDRLSEGLDSDRGIQTRSAPEKLRAADKIENVPAAAAPAAPSPRRDQLADASSGPAANLRSESEIQLRRPAAAEDRKRLNTPSPAPASKDAERDRGFNDGVRKDSERSLASDATKVPAEEASRLAAATSAASGGSAEAKSKNESLGRAVAQAEPKPSNQPPLDAIKLKEVSKYEVAQNAAAPTIAPESPLSYGFDQKKSDANSVATGVTKPQASTPKLTYDTPQSDSFSREKETVLALGPAIAAYQPAPPSVAAPTLGARLQAPEQQVMNNKIGAAQQVVRFQSAQAAPRPTRQLDETLLKRAVQPLPSPLASTFDLRQYGEVIEIVDSDGSIYNGRILSSESLPAVQQKEPRSYEFQVTGKQSNARSDVATNVNFTASGTNRTLRRIVLITGNITGQTSADAGFQPKNTIVTRAAGVPQSGIGGRASLDGSAPVAEPASLGFVPIRLRGILRVDKTNEIKVDATRVAP